MDWDKRSGSVRSHTHASHCGSERNNARICKRAGSATAFSSAANSSAVARSICSPNPDGQQAGPSMGSVSTARAREPVETGMHPY